MAINNASISEIEGFWKWFNSNCQNFGKHFENTELLEELDDRISKLGDFSWEIGPGKVEENALVISPNGDLDLLEFTKEIIAQKIDCSNWEFYYAKPPKQWNMVFNYQVNEINQTEIDASAWSYVLLKYEDGMFGIIIKAANLNKFDEEDKIAAAEIALDGVLGEEIRMQTICEIEVVEEFEKAQQGKASDIKLLDEHLKSLTGSVN